MGRLRTRYIYFRQARNHIKIPEGTKLLTMKFTTQGKNDGEVLYLKQKVQAKRSARGCDSTLTINGTGGGTVPLECDILALTRALHEKNEAKSRWYLLGRSRSAASELNMGLYLRGSFPGLSAAGRAGNVTCHEWNVEQQACNRRQHGRQ